MKIKTNELIDDALDWAVAKCEGMADDMLNDFDEYGWAYSESRRYSTDWSQGGPIIEREWIDLHCVNDSLWEAECPAVGGLAMQNGPTPLIAAMRCHVASELGDEVDVPEELCRPIA
jgi:hypothetical protein